MRPARLLLLALVVVVVSSPRVLAFTAGDGPRTEPVCPDSGLHCVDATVQEMERRATPLITSCDHDTIFSMLYLRTTQEVRQSLADPGYFVFPDTTYGDPAFVTRQDALFADFYFWAYDNWHGERSNGAGTGNQVDPSTGAGIPSVSRVDRGEVPAAWAVAFDAAENQRVSGFGNVLLGANAHIQRDLPFVLYAMGLGSKADHDKVNVVLERVADRVLDEMARRFDQTLATGNPVPGTTLDNKAFLLLSIEAWREQAWHNAESLRDAPDDAARAVVADGIEHYAEMQALLLAAEFAYPVGPVGDLLRTARNTHCAAHHFDA